MRLSEVLQAIGVIGLGACAPTGNVTGPVPVAERYIVVTTAEFGASGSLAVVNADTLEVFRDVTTTHHDAYVRTIGDALYVLNRQGADNVQRLNPDDGFATAWEYSVGERSNPWDLVDVGDGRAAVVLYETAEIALVNLNTSPFDTQVRYVVPAGNEPDGRAEAGALLVEGERLYVLVQGLGSYPRCNEDSRGSIIALNKATLALDTSFAEAGRLVLAACNPMSWVTLDDGTVLVAQSGNHRSLVGDAATDDGLLEHIDLQSGVSLGVLATEATFGDADLLRIVRGDAGRLWGVFAHADFSMTVHPLTVSNRQASWDAAVWEGEGIFDVDEYYGRLWIADRRRPGAALVVIEADSPYTNTPVLLNTGYAPFDIAAIEPAMAQ